MHPHSEARGAAAEFPTLPDICVLVVDDDPDALGLVREILESAGARVRTATSARSALESIEESRARRHGVGPRHARDGRL